MRLDACKYNSRKATDLGKKIESTSQHLQLKNPYQISLFPSEIIANIQFDVSFYHLHHAHVHLSALHALIYQVNAMKNVHVFMPVIVAINLNMYAIYHNAVPTVSWRNGKRSGILI